MPGNVTEAARLLARVGADTSEFDSKMRKVSASIGTYAKDFDQKMQRAGLGSGGAKGGVGVGLADSAKKAGSAIASMAGIATGLGVVSLAALGRQATSTLNEFARLGAQTEMVSNGFEGLAGGGAEDMLAQLRTAAQGTIDDYSLMLSANRAMMLGVADTGEEMTKLMEVAMRRGQAMGLSTRQAFDDIVTGIGRASPLILDNLGIVVNADETYRAYANSIGIATDALTEQQKTQALAARVMSEATGELMELGGAAAPATLDTAISNLRAEIALSVDGWRELMSAIASGAEETTERLREARVGRETQLDFSKTIWDLDLPYEQLVDATARMNELRQSYDNGTLAADVYAKKMAELKDAYTAGRIGVIEYRDSVDELDASYKSGELGMSLYQDRADNMMQTLIQLAAAHSQVGIAAEIAERQLANFSSAELALMSTRPGWGLGTDVQYGTGKRSVITQEQADKNRRKYLLGIGWSPAAGGTEPTAAGGAGRVAASSAQAEAESRAREWETFVSGLLQPTTVTEADMAATQAGVYQDKWDEAVRRFRMAEQGHNAYEVQQFEKQFYGGQMLEQVNWGGLIASAQEQLALEQGQKNLLNTAMQKLGEAGIGLGREQVSNLLGLPADYEAVGAERAQSLEAGLAQADLGTTLADSFDAQIKADASRWIVFGETMGDWLVEGLENTAVGGGFIDAVVALVLPRVQEALAGNSMP